MSKRPPKYSLRFFRWFCDPEYRDDIQGDLMERFQKNPSNWRFTVEVLKLFRPSLIKISMETKSDFGGMLKHNIKISYRNLMRRKSFAFLNIGGLVFGLTITLLISLWIHSELTFNKKNEHYDKVVRVLRQITINENVRTSWAVPFPLTLKLGEEYGNDFEHFVPATWFGDRVLNTEENVITAYGGFIGADAPELMSLKMLRGNKKSLDGENNALLSASAAKAMFGETDPIGKTISRGSWNMIVTGIFADIPSSSTFHGISFLGNWDFYVASVQWKNKINWNGASFRLFAQLKEDANMEVVNQKIERVIPNDVYEGGRVFDTKVFLHPMKDWHLRSNWKNGVQAGGDIQYVWWFGIIGVFVLILACVNYMNLSTAQSIKRAKEVGIRKSIGGFRGQLVAQFLTESILTVFIAFLIACIIAYFLLPYFNYLTEKEITMPLQSPVFWVIGIGFVSIVGILSGSYPALYLSSFNPTQVLKGTFRNTLSAAFFRKFLVVFQFTVAVILIIGTMIISQQIDYSLNRPIGYDQAGTISVEMSGVDYQKNDIIRNDLLASGVVTHFTQSSAPLTEIWTENDDIYWEGMDTGFQSWFCTYFVNHNYGKTIQWEIINGRDFSEDLASDSTSVIINEAALAYMQMKEPIGKLIKRAENFRIIGVVKDMLNESPFREVRPTIYFINRGDMANFQLMRLNPNIPTLDAIAKVEEIYVQHNPKSPFSFDFISEVHKKKFQKIERIGGLSKIFSSLAIFISCLGLFGLASFMVEQRTKEIGIRKILGAPFLTLWKMLSSEFVTLVTISCVIATPMAYLVMSQWLNDYEYRTPMDGWVFLIACLLTLFITMITVSMRSVKVVNTNPAEILKDE